MGILGVHDWDDGDAYMSDIEYRIGLLEESVSLILNPDLRRWAETIDYTNKPVNITDTTKYIKKE